jgi:hypothetical protein
MAPRQQWGYRAAPQANGHVKAGTLESRIFDLKDGENLPAGWSPTPLKGQHPHDIELGIMPDEPPKGKGA